MNFGLLKIEIDFEYLINKRNVLNSFPGVESTEFKDFSYEPNVRQHSNGTLEFTSVAKSNQGHYLCEAKNNIGSGISKVVFLRVNCK